MSIEKVRRPVNTGESIRVVHMAVSLDSIEEMNVVHEVYRGHAALAVDVTGGRPYQ